MDPILIVCYTNHALDQFLEGILSNMKAIGIPPDTNLVRVGGRSKVEAIEQYAIHRRRQYYHQNHLFDHTFASTLRRAREELKKIQGCRADLKSLYKGLCNSVGVVNFAGLLSICESIHTELSKNSLSIPVTMKKEDMISEVQKTIPEELWKIFYASKQGLLNWLGLSNNFFEEAEFDPESRLRKLFRISEGRLFRTEETTENENDDKNSEDDDGELKAMLEAHRLDEEIQMEDTSAKRVAAKVPHCALARSDFNAARQNLQQQYVAADKRKDKEKLSEIVQLLWYLQEEERVFENKAAFLKLLLVAYHECRVELPEVTAELLARSPDEEQSYSEKWAIYFRVVECLKNFVMQNIVVVEDAIIIAQEKFAEISNKGDGIILKKAMVVGLTTTGAAKYNTLLRMMKSRIGKCLNTVK